MKLIMNSDEMRRNMVKMSSFCVVYVQKDIMVKGKKDKLQEATAHVTQ